MRGKFSQLTWLWKNYAFKHKFLWYLALLLQLSFFFVSAVLPFFFKKVIDSLTALDSKAFLTSIVTFLIIEVSQVILLYSKGFFTRLIEIKVLQKLNEEIYRKFHTISYIKALQMKTGEILQRLTSDIPQISSLVISDFSELLGHILLITVILFIMFKTAPLLAIVSLFLVFVYSIGYLRYQKKVPELAKIRQEAQSEYIAEAEEGLNASYSIRIHGAMQSALKRFSEKTKNYFDKSFYLYRFNLRFQFGFTYLITLSAELGILFIGGWLIFNGKTTVGTLIAFTQYINWLVTFVNFMSNFAMQVEPSLVSLGRVKEILDMQEDWEVEEIESNIQAPNYPHAIEIENLDFEVGENKIFENFNLVIPKNKIVAILGKSGRGKTTLINLMLKLYTPSKGKIKIFGDDVKEIPLSKSLGYTTVIEQEPKFFSGKLQDMFGNDGKLYEISKKIGLEKFAEEFSTRNLSSSKLSELSGGERKRLGILRGLMKDAPIIIMDEPTSFLDQLTAETIMENLRKNFKDKTIIIFTHDTNVLKYCDEKVEI